MATANRIARIRDLTDVKESIEEIDRREAAEMRRLRGLSESPMDLSALSFAGMMASDPSVWRHAYHA